MRFTRIVPLAGAVLGVAFGATACGSSTCARAKSGP